MGAGVASAGIGAIGDVAGGIASGKGAKKAAKIQQKTAQMQIDALKGMYEENKSLMMPTYQNGMGAESQINSLLGINGADPSKIQSTLENTPGYQFSVNEALKGVNSNAYATGAGNSGAVQKALEQRANDLASTNYNNYFNQLSSVADRGTNAMNGLVSEGDRTVSQENTATGNAGDAASANAVYQGQNLANVLKGISGQAGSLFGSSYSKKGS